MTTASAVPTTTAWVALALLWITCVGLIELSSDAEIATTFERERVDPDDGIVRGLELDLEPVERLEIENRWGETRVEHADIARISIAAPRIHDPALAHGFSGPIAVGWLFAIRPIGKPWGTIDLVVRVPRTTIVVVNAR